MRRRNGLATAAKIGPLALAVQGLDVSARGQAIGFQPIPAPFPSGAMLDVTPAASADRRYVRTILGVSSSDLTGFTTYQVPAAVSGGGAGMNGLIGGILGGGGLGGPGGLGGGGSSVPTRPTGPIAPVTDPDFGSGLPAGDPFEQALKAPVGPVALAPSLSARSGKNPLRSRPAQLRAGRTRRRASSRPQTVTIPGTMTVTPQAESSDTARTETQSGFSPLDP